MILYFSISKFNYRFNIIYNVIKVYLLNNGIQLHNNHIDFDGICIGWLFFVTNYYTCYSRMISTIIMYVKYSSLQFKIVLLNVQRTRFMQNLQDS